MSGAKRLGIVMNGRGGMISLGLVYTDEDGRSVRVTHLFPTIEGVFATIRHPDTDTALGNVPAKSLDPPAGRRV